jgi:predicted secreted protein
MALRPSRLGLAALAAALASLALQFWHAAPIGNVLAAAIYFIMWWLALFVALPIGVTTQHDGREMIHGTAASAPVAPRFARIVAITTIFASVLFAFVVLAIRYNLVRLG